MVSGPLNLTLLNKILRFRFYVMGKGVCLGNEYLKSFLEGMIGRKDGMHSFGRNKKAMTGLGLVFTYL